MLALVTIKRFCLRFIKKIFQSNGSNDTGNIVIAAPSYEQVRSKLCPLKLCLDIQNPSIMFLGKFAVIKSTAYII